MKLDPVVMVSAMDQGVDRDSGCPDSPMLPNKVSDVPRDLLRTFPHTKRVGNYLLGKTLGEGSFAKVKEGLHTITGEKVAVKVIDKKKAREDAYVRKNLRREGRLLQQVRNRYVVQLYEIMETENSYYLVMELCEGGDLMDLICSRKRLDEKDTRRYIRQVVCAVDYLHKAGILHRDLKVENLLLDVNRDIKIIDFGLSNAVRVSHTKEGSTFQEYCVTQCGSPAYAAPELLGNKKYGPKVDVWSIGVNMYAMLTGNLPFTVEPFNIKTLHTKMLNGDMNPIPDHVSANCRDLLRKFLVADPDKRISLKEAMEHPWLTEGRNRPPEDCPFPNKLCADNLENSIVTHMSQNLDFRLSEVIRLATANIPNTATATYNLFLRKLNRYTGEMRVQGKVAAAEAQMVAANRGQHQVMLNRVKTADVIDLIPISNAKPQPNIARANHGEGAQDPKILDMTMSPRKIKPAERLTYRRLGRNQMDRPGMVASTNQSRNTQPARRVLRPGGATDHNTTDQSAEARTAEGNEDKGLRAQVHLYQLPGATQGTTVKKVAPETVYKNECGEEDGDSTKYAAKDSARASTPHDLPPISQDKSPTRNPRLNVHGAGTNHTARDGLYQQQQHQQQQQPQGTNALQNNTHHAENSSQSTTASSCNGGGGHHSNSSGPGMLTHRKAMRTCAKTATVSDPSTKKERKIAAVPGTDNLLRSSPKRITIDLDNYEVFKRNAGMPATAVSMDWQDRKAGPSQQYAYQGFSRARTFNGPRPLIKKNSVNESNTECSNPSNNLTLVSVNVSTDRSPGNGLARTPVSTIPVGGVTPRVGRVLARGDNANSDTTKSGGAEGSTADTKTLVFPAISPPLVSTKAQAELKE